MELWLGAALGDGVGIVGLDVGGPPDSSLDEFCRVGVGRWPFIEAEAVGLVCVAVGRAAWGIGTAGLATLELMCSAEGRASAGLDWLPKLELFWGLPGF